MKIRLIVLLIGLVLIALYFNNQDTGYTLTLSMYDGGRHLGEATHKMGSPAECEDARAYFEEEGYKGYTLRGVCK